MYHKHGVNLSEGQKSKLSAAYKKGIRISLKLSNEDLHGNYMLALMTSQLNKLRKAKNGVQLHLSLAQLKYMSKTGGFLTLLALIQLIAGAVGVAGGLNGGLEPA